MATVLELLAKAVPTGPRREAESLATAWGRHWAAEQAADAVPPLDACWSRAAYPLRQFVEEAWPIIEPQPYTAGFHIEAMCQHLEASTETALGTGRLPTVRNLLINVPPRHTKSLVVAVLWPAWVWISAPQFRFLFVSYAADRALDDAVKCRTLMQSEWYQRQWGSQWHFTTDQRVKGYYANTRLGYRISTSVGGMATGFGGDAVIGDDLHSTSEDLSQTRAEIKAAVDFWRTVIPSRVTDPARTVKVVVGQRVGTDDISGELLQMGTYEYLRIPMEYQAANRLPPTCLGWEDPRTTEGEVICPARFPASYVAEQRQSLGHRYQAQYQQQPTTAAGTLFPRHLWRFYPAMPHPEMFDLLVMSADLNFGSETHAGSYVAIQVWGKRGVDAFLLDRFFERVGYVETKQAIRRMALAWPGAYHKYIENKANGPAVLADLRTVVYGLIPVQVDGRHGSKYARAQAVSGIQQSGHAYLPSRELAPWVDDYITYLERFPAEPNDDGDATSQAWSKLFPPVPLTNQRQLAQRAADQLARQQQAVLVRSRHGARPSAV